LAWGVFGGLAFVGFLASFGITAENLEGEEWDEEDGGTTEDADEDEDEDDAQVGRP
jgi:hypothetical protein